MFVLVFSYAFQHHFLLPNCCITHIKQGGLPVNTWFLKKNCLSSQSQSRLMKTLTDLQDVAYVLSSIITMSYLPLAPVIKSSTYFIQTKFLKQLLNLIPVTIVSLMVTDFLGSYTKPLNRPTSYSQFH